MSSMATMCSDDPQLMIHGEALGRAGWRSFARWGIVGCLLGLRDLCLRQGCGDPPLSGEDCDVNLHDECRNLDPDPVRLVNVLRWAALGNAQHGSAIPMGRIELATFSV